MEHIFEVLSEEEMQNLRHSVAWVTILIAGADGHIDSKELEWAKKIEHIREYSSPEELEDFYAEVGKDFNEFLINKVEETNQDKEGRMALATSKIEALNPILAKLHPKYGAAIYKSLVSFARHVAKASGGFLRMWSIGYEENKYIKLPMLQEITYEEPTDNILDIE